MKTVIAACLLILTVCAVLSLSSSGVDAGDNMAKKPVYGWIYPSSEADYKAGLPEGVEGRNQRGFIDATHFAYPLSGNNTTDRYTQQRLLHNCLDNGWSVAAVQGDAILIYHPNLPVWVGARRN